MQKPKTTCKTCQCSISNNNYNKHVASCKGKISWFVRNANGLPVGSKYNKKHGELNWTEIQFFYDDGHTFMEVCKQFKISSSTLSKAIKDNKFITRSVLETKHLRGTDKGRLHTEEQKKQISLSMRKAVLEGRQKTPRPYGDKCLITKHTSWLGNEEILHGGWELKVAQFLDLKQINWTKCKESFTYIWENTYHEYFPDFFLKNTNEYVEVKGWTKERDIAKWSQFPHQLKILTAEHINNLEKFFKASI